MPAKLFLSRSITRASSTNISVLFIDSLKDIGVLHGILAVGRRSTFGLLKAKLDRGTLERNKI
jgi:hypothetical protein